MDLNDDGLFEVGTKSLQEKIKRYPEFFDEKQTFLNNKPGVLISPLFKKTRLEYTIMEFEVLMDSSNMNSTFIRQIAKIIVEKEEQVDCIIIIHGTNTMEYTASALSFMLNNLNKTIIVTGSQIPLSGENNDAFHNLLGSFQILSALFIPEVCIYFNHKLLRGNRTKKTTSTKFDGFDSTIPPLVRTDINLTINSEVFLSRKIHKSLEVWPHLSDEWVFIKQTPLTTQSFLQRVFAQTIFRCVIFDSKSGFDSCYADFFLLNQCKQLIEDGKIILMLTNFEEENNEQVDRVHRELVNLGVVMDNSITIAAALAKVAVLLGNFSDNEDVVRLLRSNLKGETDLRQETHSFKAHHPNIVYKLIQNAQNLRNTEVDLFIDNIQFELEKRLLDSEQTLLIESVLDLTKFSTQNNRHQSALHLIVLTKSVEFLDMLGTKGVDFNQLDSKGNSCLFVCLQAKQYAKCRVILKHKGELMASQKQLNSAVIRAVVDGDVEFFK